MHDSIRAAGRTKTTAVAAQRKTARTHLSIGSGRRTSLSRAMEKTNVEAGWSVADGDPRMNRALTSERCRGQNRMSGGWLGLPGRGPSSIAPDEQRCRTGNAGDPGTLARAGGVTGPDANAVKRDVGRRRRKETRRGGRFPTAPRTACFADDTRRRLKPIRPQPSAAWPGSRSGNACPRAFRQAPSRSVANR